MHVGAILLSTRNSDTRSITRTVRIDEDVQDAIEHLAEQQNLSVNALVNKALRKFAFWDAALEKFEAIATPSQLLVKMMDYLSDQNAKELARSAGTNIAKELMQFMFKQVNLDSVLRHFELQGVHHVSIHFDHANEGDAHTIVMRHTMGPKWSIFYEELIRSLFSELGIMIELERLDNQVTGRFRTTRSVHETTPRAPMSIARAII
ncbi:MAG: hypothetical protein AUG17_00535 [Crenarchaeota archaeon 13_1_20CM_2_53_14]|nr:MAG: hypothetical protein AUI07_02850 [archaeon 13_2_20CM_2_53_6]OLE59896.1 MAG: hypothetical protein AUG17_00535 [Crenarchaeota archaeon 13_1_20CM_2_53_14]